MRERFGIGGQGIEVKFGGRVRRGMVLDSADAGCHGSEIIEGADEGPVPCGGEQLTAGLPSSLRATE